MEGYDEFFTYKFIEIVNGVSSKNTIIGILYRPPGANTVRGFTDHLNHLLPKLTKEKKNVLLTGYMKLTS